MIVVIVAVVLVVVVAVVAVFALVVAVVIIVDVIVVVDVVVVVVVAVVVVVVVVILLVVAVKIVVVFGSCWGPRPGHGRDIIGTSSQGHCQHSWNIEILLDRDTTGTPCQLRYMKTAEILH